MPTPFVSERHLLQVASIANAVARTEAWLPWEALVWLAQCVDDALLRASLHTRPTSAVEDVTSAGEIESKNVWQSLAARAKRNKVNRDPMPPAASTWYVHADDLAAFADGPGLSVDLRDALMTLASRHRSAQSHTSSMAGQLRKAPSTPALPRLLDPPRGKAYWQGVLFQHIRRIDALHNGRATALQAIAYLKALDDERLVKGGAVDRLVWKTDGGTPKTINSKTVSNVLPEARSYGAK